MKSLRIDLLGVVFVLVWSSGYLVGALATRDIAPLTVTLWRFLLAAIVLAVLAGWRRERWPRGRELAVVAAIGLPMFALQFGALYTAMADGLSAGTTALIACSSPLVVAAVAARARWERLSPVGWFGIVLGVVGVAVTLFGRVGRPPSLVVLLWGVAGLVGLAAGTILQSRLRTTAGPMAVASVEVAAGAAVLAVWAPLKGSLAMPLTVPAVTTFLWLALVTGVGAPVIMFALIQRRGATGASSLLFVVPAVTAVVAWPLLGTPLAVTAIAGLGVAAAGLVLTRRGLRPVARHARSGAPPCPRGYGQMPVS